MESFVVTFRLESHYYDNDALNIVTLVEKEFSAEDLDSLFDLLEDMETLDALDDSVVFNEDAESEPDEVNVEYIKINDHLGKVVYQDEDFIE